MILPSYYRLCIEPATTDRHHTIGHNCYFGKQPIFSPKRKSPTLVPPTPAPQPLTDTSNQNDFAPPENRSTRRGSASTFPPFGPGTEDTRYGRHREYIVCVLLSQSSRQYRHHHHQHHRRPWTARATPVLKTCRQVARAECQARRMVR